MRFKQPPEQILKNIGIYEPENINLELIAFDFNIFQSVFFNSYDFISLLWWKDESQLGALTVT